MRKFVTIGLIIVQPEPHCRRYTQVSRIHQRNRVSHNLACYRCGKSLTVEYLVEQKQPDRENLVL